MKDNRYELFPIVGKDGEFLGTTSRGHAHDGCKILHPVVHLHVFNSNGELYLQKRPGWKDIQPNKWDTAVGGHVDLGENMETALRREALEELGSQISHPYPWAAIFLTARRSAKWCMSIVVYMTGPSNRI